MAIVLTRPASPIGIGSEVNGLVKNAYWSPTNSLVLVLYDNTEVDIGAPTPMFDDYQQADTRPVQTGNNNVLTFTFDAEVQLVLVNPIGTEGAISYVAVDSDQTPAVDVGMPAPANQPSHFFGNRTSIDIWAPVGLKLFVTGYRRTAV